MARLRLCEEDPCKAVIRFSAWCADRVLDASANPTHMSDVYPPLRGLHMSTSPTTPVLLLQHPLMHWELDVHTSQSSSQGRSWSPSAVHLVLEDDVVDFMNGWIHYIIWGRRGFGSINGMLQCRDGREEDDDETWMHHNELCRMGWVLIEMKNYEVSADFMNMVWWSALLNTISWSWWSGWLLLVLVVLLLFLVTVIINIPIADC